MNKNLLIVYVKNAIPGYVKKRIAEETGNQVAADIYSILLEKTKEAIHDIPVDKRVSYHSFIKENDLWDSDTYQKTLQRGVNLGDKMYRDITRGLEDGYQNVVLVGSDIYDLSKEIVEEAFNSLEKNTCVLGPAKDGGYYLIGFRRDTSDILEIFRRINWGTDGVLKATREKLEQQNIDYKLLAELNDIDTKEDIPAGLWRTLDKKLGIKN